MAANFNASLIPDHRSGLAGQIAKGAPWWRYAISRLYPSTSSGDIPAIDALLKAAFGGSEEVALV